MTPFALGYVRSPFRLQSQLRQCIHLSRSRRPTWRSSSTSAVRQYATKKPSASSKQSKATPQNLNRTVSIVNPSSGLYKSYAETLAGRTAPILLYTAPSPIMFITGSYLFAGFCFAYAGINGYEYLLRPPESIAYFVPIAFGGVCLVMAFFGTWSISRAYRIVRSITAVPNSSGQLRLSFESVYMLPKLRPKTVTVPYNDVVFSARMYTPEVKQSLGDIVKRRAEEFQNREMNRSRLMTLPFRQANYWLWRGFKALQNFGFASERFIYVGIKGNNGTWKLDRNAAWALDDGRALDRLVKRKSIDA